MESSSNLCCACIANESPIYSRALTSNFKLSPPQTLAHQPARRRVATKLPKLNQPHVELRSVAPPLLDQETMSEDNGTTPLMPLKPKKSHPLSHATPRFSPPPENPPMRIPITYALFRAPLRRVSCIRAPPHPALVSSCGLAVAAVVSNIPAPLLPMAIESPPSNALLTVKIRTPNTPSFCLIRDVNRYFNGCGLISPMDPMDQCAIDPVHGPWTYSMHFQKKNNSFKSKKFVGAVISQKTPKLFQNYILVPIIFYLGP
jgi:hypothetical protein